jgi:hypothetical protein
LISPHGSGQLNKLTRKPLDGLLANKQECLMEMETKHLPLICYIAAWQFVIVRVANYVKISSP